MDDGGQLPIPYFSGSGLACTSMLLAYLGLGEHTEEELASSLQKSGVAQGDVSGLGDVPEVQARLLQAYGLSSNIRDGGRASDLQKSLAQGHGVVAFLGAKALRKRWVPGMVTPFGVTKAGYQPVVVTSVQRDGLLLRVFFHDPHPRRGAANRALRKGPHTIWRGGKTFEQIWGVWGGWIPILGYLTLKMPHLSPMRRLQPWVFVEAWLPEA
jgi:hypothetical protein